MKMRCIIVDDDRMAIRLLTQMVEKTNSLELLKTFDDSAAAMDFISAEDVDLVFLDVEMPGMTGLEMIKVLADPPAIILVSSKREYALDGFDLEVADFLLKPPTYARFRQAVAKVEAEQPNASGLQFRGDFIFVKSDSLLVKVRIDDVLWVEALADYVALVTPEKRYICHSTMKSIEARLPADDFARVHRSYITRLDRIDAIEDNTIHIGTKLIPVGGTYRDRLLAKLDFL